MQKQQWVQASQRQGEALRGGRHPVPLPFSKEPSGLLGSKVPGGGRAWYFCARRHSAHPRAVHQAVALLSPHRAMERGALHADWRDQECEGKERRAVDPCASPAPKGTEPSCIGKAKSKQYFTKSPQHLPSSALSQEVISISLDTGRTGGNTEEHKVSANIYFTTGASILDFPGI